MYKLTPAVEFMHDLMMMMVGKNRFKICLVYSTVYKLAAASVSKTTIGGRQRPTPDDHQKNTEFVRKSHIFFI